MNSTYDWLYRAKFLIGWSAALLVMAFVASNATAQPPFPIQPNEVLSYQFQQGMDSVSTEGGLIDYSGNSYNGTALSLGVPTMKIVPGNPAAPIPTFAMAMAGDDYFPGTGIWTGVGTNKLGVAGGSFTAMAFVNRNNLKFVMTDQFVFGTAGQETLTGASPVPQHGLQLGYRYGSGSYNVLFGFWNDDSTAFGPANLLGPASNPTATPWHHMAWRYNLAAKTQDIFIDGVMVNSDGNHAPLAGSSTLLIGRARPTLNGQQAAFSGLIEYPRIFNVALTDAQIAAAAKYQY